jgi:uncharacterized protein (DUF1697 family)
MTSYAAFLRGVSPMNAKMPELARAYAKAGFEDVATVASSGNLVFRAKGALAAIEKRAAAATKFGTFIRPIAALEALLASDPWDELRVPREAKRLVTFLRERPRAPKLPLTAGNFTIYAARDREVFSAYIREPGNAAFMGVIEKTSGKDITSRTWDAIARIVKKAPATR